MFLLTFWLFIFELFSLFIFWLFELFSLRFKGGGFVKFGGCAIGCKGEFVKFNASPIFNVWYWVVPILIVEVWLLLAMVLLLLFELLFWFEKIWLTILLVKFLNWSEFTIFNIFWKGFTFWLFWFWFSLELLFWAFSCICLTSASLLKTKCIIVSSWSTNLSKVSSSLNCFPLYKSLCLIGSIL